MRKELLLALALITAFTMACGEPGPSLEQRTGQAGPVKAQTPSDEEKLRALRPDVAAGEVGIICLRLRRAHASDVFPPDLRSRCAQAMLALAEESSRASMVSKSPEEWISLATEFGASSAAISKAKKSIAARGSAQPAEREIGGGAIENESYANPEDVRQAKQFLADLPPACSGSRASASRDGTVTIRLSCVGSSNSMNGSIKIKNGIVTEIQ